VIWALIGAAHAQSTAWVLSGERTRLVRRAVKAARRAEITRETWYDERMACVEVEEPSLRIRNRVARRLRGPVETRTDCDFGWFPEGTGWVAVVVEPPAEGLLPTLEALAWPYYDLQVPSSGPIRLCAAEVVTGEPQALRELLEEEEVPVRGIGRVGACRRDPL